MKKLYKTISVCMCVILTISMLCSCTKKNNTEIKDNRKLNVVTTLFPYYDFIRQVAGDKVNITLIVPAGMDTHSFEPTTADMAAIQNSDLFVYNGGSLDHWARRVLDSYKKENITAIKMMDYVDVLTEEHKEGMEEEHDSGEEDEEEYDEHIWTSPVNAKSLAGVICEKLKETDSANSEYYQGNYDIYSGKLDELDSEFRDLVANAKRKTIILADKFPLRYFTQEYGLDYYAAFSGCSTDTEPSVDTIKFLIDKVDEEDIPVVYYLELSSTKTADTICSSTNAKKSVFYSCHNVTQKQFDSGITYIEMMEENVKALKKGLS